MTNPMNADQEGRELPIANLLPEGLTVGGRGDKIAIMAFSREITREQVLNLAAWLVALANSGGDEFEKYLAAVRSMNRISMFQKMLDDFIEVRDRQYRSDPDEAAARMDSIEHTIRRTLERLRDLHDPL